MAPAVAPDCGDHFHHPQPGISPRGSWTDGGRVRLPLQSWPPRRKRSRRRWQSRRQRRHHPCLRRPSVGTHGTGQLSPTLSRQTGPGLTTGQERLGNYGKYAWGQQLGCESPKALLSWSRTCPCPWGKVGLERASHICMSRDGVGRSQEGIGPARTSAPTSQVPVASKTKGDATCQAWQAGWT